MNRVFTIECMISVLFTRFVTHYAYICFIHIIHKTLEKKFEETFCLDTFQQNIIEDFQKTFVFSDDGDLICNKKLNSSI